MTAQTHTEHEHSHAHATPGVYLVTFISLLVLMALTIGAYLVSLGAFANNLIAMAIAVTKATLVVLFFMQVRYGSRLIWVWAGLGFIWLFLLFGTLGDYVTRVWLQAKGWS